MIPAKERDTTTTPTSWCPAPGVLFGREKCGRPKSWAGFSRTEGKEWPRANMDWCCHHPNVGACLVPRASSAGLERAGATSSMLVGFSVPVWPWSPQSYTKLKPTETHWSCFWMHEYRNAVILISSAAEAALSEDKEVWDTSAAFGVSTMEKLHL